MKPSQQQSPSWVKQIGGVESETFAQSHSNDTHTDPTAATVDSHDESERSYSPYLIVYNEDSNTFTYNDPWIEMEKPNDSCSNDYENICNVEVSEIPIAHEPAPSSPQPIESEKNDVIDAGTESAKSPIPVTVELVVPEVPVERVPEVSFPRNGCKSDR